MIAVHKKYGKPAITAVLVLWLLQGLALAAQPGRQAMSAADKAAFAKAMDAQDKGRGEEAEAILKRLSRTYPASFEVNESLGLLYAEREDFRSALAPLEKASTANPGSAVAQANLGAAYLKLGRMADAVRSLKAAARLDAANMQTQTNLGLALMEDHAPAEAAKAFAAALALDPGNADIRYNLGLALSTSGKLAEARQVVSAIPSVETSAQAQSLLAEIDEKDGKFKDAVEHAQAAMNLDPSAQNIYALGLEFLLHWTFDPAIKIFTFGTEKYPGEERLLLGLGVARYANNDFANAAPVFAELLQRSPQNALYADLLGHNCSLMPDAAEGCEQLAAFAEQHPQNASAATFAAAMILHRPGDRQDLGAARRFLDQALKSNPKLPEAWYQDGILLQMQEQWKASVEALEKAIALKPDMAKAHYHLALAYRHTGRPEEAQKEIALQQKFSRQEKDDLNARFQQVTTFLVAQH